ncbi:hypothetical protein HYU22_00775 [Candidatus Woesearchaeota archaeon]|nr:hypothetical protein [Candidatus Woesearchaeota archaeon]
MKKVKVRLRGYPGWHLECSAMASKYLGTQFDIHCGGIDHIPIHHTNEIAQSEAAFGKKPWVRYWLHNEFLVLGMAKMAKSGENFITLSVIEQQGFNALDYRYFCLGTHYRKPLMFSYEALAGAQSARKKLLEKVLELKVEKRTEKGSSAKKSLEKSREYHQQFTTAINDDLNTPQALAIVWDMLKDEDMSGKEKYNILLKFDEVLGLGLAAVKKDKIPLPVKRLAEERLQARLMKDWKKADELRQQIVALGYVVGDTKEGYEVKKKVNR